MIRKVLLVVSLLFWGGNLAVAADYGTMDQAKAMAEKAAEHLKSKGLDAAGKDFMTPGGEWHDRDLYVFVIDRDGLMLSHGDKETLVGRNLAGLRDVDGKAFIAEFMKVTEPSWVEYKWQNPQNKAVENKASYIVPVDQYLVGVGAYKQ